MKYVYYTEEQKQRANSVDLLDFLQKQGERFTRAGREWRWERHDSVTVRGNRWFRHSRKEGGYAIDFVQEFFDLNFPEAVEMLLGGENGVEWNQAEKSAPQPKKDFCLPEANFDMRRVFAYLIKQRFLDRDVLSYFAREKLIYEDKENHNAVFVGLDENGTARHAHKRGTYMKGKPYKGNVEGSNPKYSFHYIGKGNTLFVFEAPIDMLSFITLYPKNWMDHSYVTLDGVSGHAMICQLEQNPHLDKIILCLDHDEAGIEASGRLRDILSEKEYQQHSVRQSKYKDWNEDLKAIHGIQPLPAKEHPKLVLLPKICAKLPYLCEAFPANMDVSDAMSKHFNLLEPILTPGGAVEKYTEEMKGYLDFIAAGALLSRKELSRQMEQPVTVAQLIQDLQEKYRPHDDRGGYRGRVDDFKRDFMGMKRQSGAVGICTAKDYEQLCSLYFKLALGCVKFHIFLQLEEPVLLPAQQQITELTIKI